jgi:hypothetical protein
MIVAESARSVIGHSPFFGFFEAVVGAALAVIAARIRLF